MIDYYSGWSLTQLQAELVTAQNRIARGNIIGIEASGVRSRKEFKDGLPVLVVVKRLRWSLYLRAWQQINTIIGPTGQAAIATAATPAAVNTILAGYPNALQLAQQWPNPFAEQIKTTSARYALP